MSTVEPSLGTRELRRRKERKVEEISPGRTEALFLMISTAGSSRRGTLNSAHTIVDYRLISSA